MQKSADRIKRESVGSLTQHGYKNGSYKRSPARPVEKYNYFVVYIVVLFFYEFVHQSVAGVDAVAGFFG